MKKLPMVLCYDIADCRRLQKVQRRVSKLMVMVQYSVYYGVVSVAEMQGLIGELSRIIDVRVDDVRVYGVERLERAFQYGASGREGILILDGGGCILGH